MKRRLILVVLIVVVLGGLVTGVYWYARANSGIKLLARAELAVRAEQFSRAVELSEAFITKYPQDWRGYFVQGNAYIRLGRYGEARTSLEKAATLNPAEVSVSIALAETYALPAKRFFSTQGPSAQASSLAEPTEQLFQANRILSACESENGPTVDLLEAKGLNLLQIGMAQRMLSQRLKKDAEFSQTSGDMGVYNRQLQESEKASAASEQYLREAISTFLQVVTENPSREGAGRALVKLCLERNDRTSLEAARQAIMALEDPPVLLAMEFAMYDLRSLPETTTAQERQKKISETCQLLDELLERQPDQIQVKLNRATLALMLKDLDTTEKLCNEILQIDPRQYQARLLHGKLLMLRGDWTQAERELFGLKTDFPRWTEAHYSYARAALARGRKELARNAMRTVTMIDPGHPRARAYLTETLLEDGFYEQAFQDAQAYYQAHRDDGTAIKLFIRSAIATAQPSLARRELDLLKSEYSDRPDVLAAVTHGFAWLGDRKETIDLAKMTTANSSTSVADLVEVGGALLTVQAYVQAEPILASALSMDQHYGPTHFELGRLYYSTGRNMQAVEHYHKSVESDQSNVDYRLAYAAALFDRGLFEDCGQECQEILQQDPSNTSAIFLAEQVRIAQGQPVSLAGALERIETDGRSGIPLAMAYLKGGQPQKCIDLCLAELDKRPQNSSVRLLLGRAYLALGQREKCLAEWTALLKASPDRLSSYVRLADLLNETTTGPEEVRKALTAIPDARAEMVDLVVGWLYERAGDYEAAANTYGSLAGRSDAPLEKRNQASFRLAYVLGRAGHLEQALRELDELAKNQDWHSQALQGKAQILLMARRFPQANTVLDQLRNLGENQRNVSLLITIARLYSQTQQVEKALEVCDKLDDLQPDDARTHLLRAAVLEEAGRLEETIGWYRKAIECQPGNLLIYVTLARSLDNQQKPMEAIEVLEQLQDLGGVAASAGLFHQGAMFAGWGLQSQAIECFEKLNRLGYGHDPQLQLALGQGFARLGQKDSAVVLLKKIPMYAKQYTSAQQLLADLAETDQSKLEILDKLEETSPGRANILAQKMRILIDAGRSGEAIKLFKAFEEQQAEDSPLPTQVGYLALRAMLRDSDWKAAGELSLRIAGERKSRTWRRLAILFLLDSKPQAALSMFPDISGADVSETLLGVLLAHQLADDDMLKQCQSRLSELDKQRADLQTGESVPAQYKLLCALSVGSGSEAQAELADFPSGMVPGRSAAAELVSYAVENPQVAEESLQLLKASLAVDLGVQSIGRTWALEVLRARGSCQWAAALISGSQADDSMLKTVLEILEPKNCVAALIIQADLLAQAEQYAKAAEVYGLAGEQEKDNYELLLRQAVATENAGQLEQALGLYRDIWQATKNPIAANNAAYIVSQLRPSNSASLAEAELWMENAVLTSPATAAFYDTKGWIAHLQGRREEACKELYRSVKGLPDSPEVHYHMGCAQREAGNKQLARWHLSAAVLLGKAQLADPGKHVPQTAKTVELAEEALNQLNSK